MNEALYIIKLFEVRLNINNQSKQRKEGLVNALIQIQIYKLESIETNH